jgi:hypothetical protein
VTVQVCDQCGHVAAHDRGPARTVPFQPKGTTAFVTLTVAECQRANCHCDRPVWRELLPSEPAL